VAAADIRAEGRAAQHQLATPELHEVGEVRVAAGELPHFRLAAAREPPVAQERAERSYVELLAGANVAGLVERGLAHSNIIPRTHLSLSPAP
jgi:hypothetical protein